MFENAAAGICVGLLLGLTGGGGSVLAVPMLMAANGWSLRQSAPVSMLAVGLAATVGAAEAWRRGEVRYRAASLIGAVGILTAPAGALLARMLPTHALTGLFAALVAGLALRIWLKARAVRAASGPISEADSAAASLCEIDARSGRFVWTPRALLVIGGIGALAGLLSGVFGIGGGFIIVPALRAVTPLPMRSASATSLMAIGLIALSAVLSASLGGSGLPLRQAGPFAAATVTGMLGSRLFAARISGWRLEAVLALVMFAVALALLAHAEGAW